MARELVVAEGEEDDDLEVYTSSAKIPVVVRQR